MAWQAALVGAGADLAGGYFTNQANMAAVDKAADRAQANAREQMAFQERMSGSAIQRAKLDAQKAGMNPLLAMTQPSSTPSGAMGGVEAAKLENPAGRLATTAIEASRLNQQKEMNDSQIGVNNASIKQANSTTAKNAMETTLMAKDLNRKDLVDRAASAANKMIDSIGSSAKQLRDMKPELKDFSPYTAEEKIKMQGRKDWWKTTNPKVLQKGAKP